MNKPIGNPVVFSTVSDSGLEYDEGCCFMYGIILDFDKARVNQFYELDLLIKDEIYDADIYENKLSKTLIKKALKSIKNEFIEECEIVKNSNTYKWLNYWCELYIQEFINEKAKEEV